MIKLNKLMVSLTLAVPVFAMADVNNNLAASIASAHPAALPVTAPASVKNTVAASLQVATPVTVSDNGESDYSAQEGYFRHLEQLDEQIQLANKEITALQMQQQLSDLRTKMENRSHGFTLSQIQGIQGKLSAVFKLSSGSTVVVGEGEYINEGYKLKAIENSRVLVQDEKSGKTFPMMIGG